MKTGLLEKVLTRRYGQPTMTTDGNLIQQTWNPSEIDSSSTLYFAMNWKGRLGTRFASLREIYGDAFGGFLIWDCLKVAVLMPRKIYGLWRIDELQLLPPVRYASKLDRDIVFFMDSGNVLYYGHKAGRLYVFDRDTNELDSLGPIEPALQTLMDEFESARQAVRGR